MMNGARTNEISMERGIRQVPLPHIYFYLLVANVLSAMLVDPIHQVEGSTLHDGSILWNVLFADDITLFFNGTKENL